MLMTCILSIFISCGVLVVAPTFSVAAAVGDIDAAVLGSVAGTVTVAGDHQLPKRLPVFKNRAFCGAAVANQTLLVDGKGGLRNAVVLLHALAGKAAAQPGAVILDNKDCAFAPHAQVATVGSQLLLKNSDPILHTVHARIGSETLFNVGLPRWRQVIKRLDRAGVMRINCDVLHTWMSAAIVVTDTPYFAVTDAAGRFNIEGVPAGAYDVEVWHERLGLQTIRLAIAERATRILDVIYR
jgi:hypothetical protein